MRRPAVAASTDKARIEAFLKDWPKGQHAAAAKARIAELRRGVSGLRRGVLLRAGATEMRDVMRTLSAMALRDKTWMSHMESRIRKLEEHNATR